MSAAFEDGGDVVRPAGDQQEIVPGAGILGLRLFLLSLGILFAGSLIAFHLTRPPGEFAAPAPAGLWLSTLLLLASGFTAQRALVHIRRGQPSLLRRDLLWTIGIALAFCVAQIWNWFQFAEGTATVRWRFYTLTGLHALHVAGGIIAFVVVAVFAARGAYSWAHYPGVRNTVIYWHFLGAVWIVLLAALMLRLS